MKKFALALAAATMAATAAPAAAAELPIRTDSAIQADFVTVANYDDDDRRWRDRRDYRKHKKWQRKRARQYYKRNYNRRAPVRVVRVYDDRGYYVQPRRIGRNSYVWRGRDNRYYCRRDNGTTGLIIGAGVGALAGHEIAGRGDRTLGAILGGVIGGALGREIDRGGLQCR